jgi:anti-sigma factor RsiW
MKACPEFLALLSPLLDDELTPDAHARVTRHLSECAACAAEMAAIQRGCRLARAVPELDVPVDLSAAILARATDAPSRVQPRAWPLARPALATGLLAALLVMAVFFWPDSRRELPWTAEFEHAATAPPLHLEQLVQHVDSAQDLDTIAATYQLRRIDLETALRQASFPVICPLHRAGDTASVTELRDCPLIHPSALRGDQEIVLLQQPAGWPIVYGEDPVQHLTVGGQPCDRLRTDGRELLKWERGGTRWILVARGGHPELEKVVSALVSIS